MEAAKLIKVSDSISKGASFLPSAGSTSGRLPHGTAPAGPQPTAAPNSGKKLDAGISAAKFSPCDAGCGSHYPDPASDEKVA